MRLNVDYMELDGLLAKVQETLPDNEKLTRNEVKQFEAIFSKLLEVSNNGWISVKDRLPEEGKEVLVWNDESFCYVDEIKNGKWRIPGDYSGNTHWMPLPEPPQEET